MHTIIMGKDAEYLPYGLAWALSFLLKSAMD